MLTMHASSSVYSYPPRLRRMLRRSIPTAVTATFTFYAVYYLSIIILTDYRLEVYRWREFGDITTYGSYYEDSPAHRFARCAAPRFTPPLLRQSIPTAVTATFYPFYSSCSGYLLWIDS